MANYCWNWVSIEGNNDTLKLIHNRMSDYDKFNNLTDWTNHILGKKVFDISKDSPYDVVGTRWWDVNWDGIHIEDGRITIDGDSAWSPPIHLMELLAKEFNVKILIEFEEPGSDFGGFCRYDKTGQLEDHTVSYSQWRYEQDSYAYIDQFKDAVEMDLYESIKDVVKCNDFVSEEDLKELIKIYKDANKEEVQD